MAMSGGKDDGAPMLEMNMTPLIDVLLVLLIMFIITIPVATHSVDIDLPQPNPNPPPENQIDPEQNKIVLTQADEILWNGEVLGQSELVRNLNHHARHRPRARTAVRARRHWRATSSRRACST
jgi:biopolymer transport protein ExbD